MVVAKEILKITDKILYCQKFSREENFAVLWFFCQIEISFQDFLKIFGQLWNLFSQNANFQNLEISMQCLIFVT